MKEISRDEWRSGYVPPSSGWRNYILNSTRTSTSIETVGAMDGIDSSDDNKTREGERTEDTRTGIDRSGSWRREIGYNLSSSNGTIDDNLISFCYNPGMETGDRTRRSRMRSYILD